MKRTKVFAKFALALVAACFVFLAFSLFTGRLCTKAQFADNAQKWLAANTSQDTVQFSIADTREYDHHYIILGKSTADTCLLSYRKLSFLPLYSRDLITVAKDPDMTGIGFDEGKNHHMELLIASPYEEILIRDADGQLQQAPEKP